MTTIYHFIFIKHKQKQTQKQHRTTNRLDTKKKTKHTHTHTHTGKQMQTGKQCKQINTDAKTTLKNRRHNKNIGKKQ
jgi:hypothetical protein